ncbi:MAG TPA: TOMM precursor leader peptide-binding protein [Ktedonosporobacter sp.]|nr:TOMM precursor leader peptide-binding protein [Ktedonosporobacter sp.]
MDQRAFTLSPDVPRRLRWPALKRTWVIQRNPTSHSVTFTPLTPGLRAFAFHHVTAPQYRLLELLNGEYSVEMIQNRLQNTFHSLSAGVIATMLNQLDHIGLLEEANVKPPADWTPEYVLRYSRHLAVFAGYERPDLSRFEQQRRMRDAHIVLLGAGGVGSWVAMQLGQLGIGHLTIADGDEIMSSNLTRHALYTEGDIGRNKAIAAAEALYRLNSEMEVTVIAHAIENEEEMVAISRGANLVVLTFGPFLLPTPMSIHHSCFQQGVPCVALGGLHLGPLVVPGETACFTCTQSFLASQMPWQNVRPDREDEELVLGRGYYAVFAPLIAACTGLGITEISKFIAGFAPSALANGLLHLNPTDLTLTRIAIPRDPACPVCGMADERSHNEKRRN